MGEWQLAISALLQRLNIAAISIRKSVFRSPLSERSERGEGPGVRPALGQRIDPDACNKAAISTRFAREGGRHQHLAFTDTRYAIRVRYLPSAISHPNSRRRWPTANCQIVCWKEMANHPRAKTPRRRGVWHTPSLLTRHNVSPFLFDRLLNNPPFSPTQSPAKSLVFT
jgi:hypothetical protein